ncbi:alkaline phosphatase [Plesiomonas shigelloides]|nr:alkaline phosphatase [Plesiomonas shigelloides]
MILLIGDGMGDSEITAARNYANGAGGFFAGIDALPLTGQYTHYALDKRPVSQIM